MIANLVGFMNGRLKDITQLEQMQKDVLDQVQRGIVLIF